MIIGNPPWKEYSAVKNDYTVRNYRVEKSGNLYALCAERSLELITPAGYFSFIVQLPLVCSSRMVTLRQHLIERCSHLNMIPCDDRPGKLFEGLQHCRSTIFVATKRLQSTGSNFATTRYNRWATEVRNTLLVNLDFTRIKELVLFKDQFPKIPSALLASAFSKLAIGGRMPVQLVLSPGLTNHFIFYQEATGYWVKATVGIPYYAKNERVSPPAHGRYLYFKDTDTAKVVCAILNSSLFYSYFIAYGDCFHLSETLATNFPLASSVFGDSSLVRICETLIKDLKKNATNKNIKTKDGDEISYEEFNVSESKPIIDEIDRVLARHYGFTEEELDFIINYDIKYRMGREGLEEDNDI